MARLSSIAWISLLQRWCPYEPIPEVRLVAWLLGHAIADEPSAAADDGREPYRSGFFGGGFQCYCALIRLNPAFVLEQIDRANASTVKCDRQSAGRRPHQGGRWPSLAAQRKARA